MPKLPSLKPKQVIKKFEKIGFIKDRQSGSHVNFKDLPKGTLHAILKQTGVIVEEFLG